MAKKYFMEADDIEIDVQVGPEKEEETVADPVEAVPNPVELAKAKPENVPVACEKKEDGVCEFYVDAADVDKYATYAKCGSMLEALNNIIVANEGSGLRADNLTVVVNEATKGFVRNLEKHGAACMMIHEADESAAADNIEIDVQVGPNGEETEVKADPQEANPVDAVRREYDNVVIAQKDKDFFMDVEDVQKCAELNCESVITTLNKIIAAHEDSKMDASNIVLLVHENTDATLLDKLDESGVVLEANFTFMPKIAEKPELKDLYGACKEAETLLNSEGEMTKATANKFGKTALRVLDVIENVSDFIALPMCILIVPIPAYLIGRLWSWAFRAGQEAITANYAEKCIEKYKALKEKATDKKLQDKYQAEIDKLTKKMVDLKKSVD